MKNLFTTTTEFLPVTRHICYLAVGCFILLCGGCHSRKIPDLPPASAYQESVFAEDTELHVDFLLVDSIHLTFADDLRSDTFIHEKDWNTLAEHMITCTYDTFRNQSDIHVTMVPPDYTLCIKYKEMPADHKDWLLIWEEAGVAKYRDLWFHLSETSRSPVYNLLHRYKP
ncbi:MAG: hypothetical protein LUF85_11730 [Bacteroides sp.]|nr:hypothetical protein [Bacteroides sp.]